MGLAVAQFNPFDAEANFIHEKKMQKVLRNI